LNRRAAEAGNAAMRAWALRSDALGAWRSGGLAVKIEFEFALDFSRIVPYRSSVSVNEPEVE